MDASKLFPDERRLEQYFGRAEALIAYSDSHAIWQLICLLKRRALSRSLHFLIEVKCHIAKPLLDISHDFSLSCCCEGVSSLQQNLHHVVSEVTPC